MTNDRNPKSERMTKLEIRRGSWSQTRGSTAEAIARGSAIWISSFFRRLAFVIRILLSFLRYRFIEIQNCPAHHRPGGDFVQVHVGRNVFKVRHSHAEGRGAALFKIAVLLVAETENRVEFAA